jgi:hypothetical protein
MIAYLGYLGDVFLVWGVWQMGNRQRYAHLVTVVGELCWIVMSLARGEYELTFICVLFAALAFRAWIKWAPETPRVSRCEVCQKYTKYPYVRCAKHLQKSSPWTD